MNTADIATKIDTALAAIASLQQLVAELEALKQVPGYGTDAGMSDEDLAKVRAMEVEAQAMAQAVLDKMPG